MNFAAQQHHVTNAEQDLQTPDGFFLQFRDSRSCRNDVDDLFENTRITSGIRFAG